MAQRMEVPEEVRGAAHALAELREAGAKGLELAHAAGTLKRTERAYGITADGEPFKESETAPVGSLRQAIDAKCRDCIVDDKCAGTAAVQVELCPCYGCPLWPVRAVRDEPRVFYSRAVLEEQGLDEALAQWRFRHPRRPPEDARHEDGAGAGEVQGQ